jgi:hypothetical protein
MIQSIINNQSATVRQSAFIRGQFPEPLPSGAGSTDVFAMKNEFAQHPATVKKDVLILNQYPAPLKSNIGKEDLPGGFRSEAILNGQSEPVGDLARGVVQVNGVKILYSRSG